MTRDQIHRLRVTIKRLRAIWRLARERVGDRVYRIHVSELRDLASRLAPERDRAVLMQSLEKIHAPRELFVVPRMKSVPPPPYAVAVRILFESSLALNELPWKKKYIRAALDDSRRRLRKARRKAKRKSATPVNFHEWRKRAKDRMYQLEFAAAMGLHASRKRLRRLDKLTDRLGKAHDFDVLAGHLKEEHAPSALIGKAESRRHHFEHKSLEMTV